MNKKTWIGRNATSKLKGFEMKELIEQRKALSGAVSMSYSPDDFPGSREWRETQELQGKLKEFDAAHPGIIAEIKAEKKAKDAAVAKKAGWI